MVLCPNGFEHRNEKCYDSWCRNECDIPTDKDKEIAELQLKIEKFYKILDECPFKEDKSKENDYGYNFIVKPVLDWVQRLREVFK